MSKFKNCPFCGCPEVDTIEVKTQVGDDEPTYSYGAECWGCNATVTSVKKWNMRVCGWISIDVEPEEGKFYNVKGGDIDGVSSGFYAPAYGKDGFDCVVDDRLELVKVTHYQPVPSA